MSFIFDAPLSDFDRKRYESGKSEIMTNYTISSEAQKVLDRTLVDFLPETKIVYLHILLSARHDRDFWVPLPTNTIRAYSREADNERARLVESGLLEKSDSFGPKKCYEYRVAFDVRRAFYDAEAHTQSLKRVDPLTKEVRNNPAKTRHYDSNRNPRFEPIRAGLRALQQGRFDLNGVVRHLDHEAALARKAEAALALNGGGLSRAEYDNALYRIYGRYDNDARCFMSLLNQDPRHINGRHVVYRLAYQPTITGRISQMGGGLQSCSRSMKAAAYRSIDGVKNYDIKSSQAFILQALLNEQGLDTTWIDAYLKEDKAEYAKRAGVPVDVWKQCFYALCFGASLRFAKGPNQQEWSFRTILIDYVNHHRMLSDERVIIPISVEADELFRRVKDELLPFSRVLNQYRRSLDELWVLSNSTYCKSGRRIKNAAGVFLDVKTYESWPGNRSKRLASFILQGVEAGFIHTLTASLSEHGVIPISNEHDGIVTIGEIPAQAIQDAQEACNTPYLQLVEKPFEPLA